MIKSRTARLALALVVPLALLAGCTAATPAPAATTQQQQQQGGDVSMAGMNMGGASSASPKIYPVGTGSEGEKPREDGLMEAAYTIENGVKVFHLKAVAVTWETTKGTTFTAWTFNGHVPGPVLHVKEGEHVRIVVENDLAEPTSVHWHGLDVPNNVDGVGGVTQDPIMPGQTYTYDFVVPNQHGTNMYHAHMDDYTQISNGLFGPMIIDPADPSAEPKVDHDMIEMISDGNLGFTLNGKTFPDTKVWTFKKGETVRVRYINIGNQVHPMHMHGFNVNVIAKDGNPEPQPWRKVNTVDLMPGDLYDVLVTLDRSGVWAWHCHNISHVVDSKGNMTGLVQVAKVVD